ASPDSFLQFSRPRANCGNRLPHFESPSSTLRISHLKSRAYGAMRNGEARTNKCHRFSIEERPSLEEELRLPSNPEFSDASLAEAPNLTGASGRTTRSITRHRRRFGNCFAVRQGTFRRQAGPTDLI